MNRRLFLKTGSFGLAALAFCSPGLLPVSFGTFIPAAGSRITLSIREVLAEMVDLTSIPMWAFEDEQLGARIPGPVVFALEGERIGFKVINRTGRERAFMVQGVTRAVAIPSGKSTDVVFEAPAAGTYMYFDPLYAPVSRVMGLHGALVVLPRTGNTPYSRPTWRVQTLFNDLGTTERFPGQPWSADRTWVWAFNTVDPEKNQWVSDRPTSEPINPALFLKGYLPRYFTINGKSGYFAAHDPEIMPSGRIGQPGLVRVLNAGLATHSAHIHGNHVFLLSEDGKVRNNLPLVDTWSMPPGSIREVLLPFSRPPDIPPAAWPPSEESFPFHYPIHCHTQMSQIAAGGNYPQGLSVHWMLVSE